MYPESATVVRIDVRCELSYISTSCRSPVCWFWVDTRMLISGIPLKNIPSANFISCRCLDMSDNSENILENEYGVRLLIIKKLPMQMNTISTISGFVIRRSEIPAALSDSSSLFSPSDPIVIIEPNSTASGSPIGISVAEAYIISSRITPVESPFPTRLSMCIHR